MLNKTLNVNLYFKTVFHLQRIEMNKEKLVCSKLDTFQTMKTMITTECFGNKNNISLNAMRNKQNHKACLILILQSRWKKSTFRYTQRLSFRSVTERVPTIVSKVLLVKFKVLLACLLCNASWKTEHGDSQCYNDDP